MSGRIVSIGVALVVAGLAAYGLSEWMKAKQNRKNINNLALIEASREASPLRDYEAIESNLAILASAAANERALGLYEVEPFSPEDFHARMGKVVSVLKATVSFGQGDLQGEVVFEGSNAPVAEVFLLSGRLESSGLIPETYETKTDVIEYRVEDIQLENAE